MSKFTLGQRQFPTLGLRSQQSKNYVGPTLSCYLGYGYLSQPIRRGGEDVGGQMPPIWTNGFMFVQFFSSTARSAKELL